MRRPAAIALGLLLLASPAVAQEAEAPAVVVEPAGEAEAALEAEKHVTAILAIGDAIGGGLGAGLARVTEPSGDYDVSVRLNEESGLARPEVYDWAATVDKILAANAFDVIVVQIGANDRQTIRDGDKRYAFNSPEWTAAYRQQIDRLLDRLLASSARVVWVSPPPMKDPDYDAAVKVITDLQRAQVTARGATFVDIRPQFSNPDGSYADAVTDDAGNTIKLRGRDGISFFKTGNNRMAEVVLAAIESDPAAEAGKTSRLDSPGATKTDSEAAAPKLDEVPLFGQAVMDAEPYTVQPEGVTANAILLAAGDIGPEAALKTLRDIAPKDSGAERLFRLGQPKPPPAGRADDFALPAEP